MAGLRDRRARIAASIVLVGRVGMAICANGTTSQTYGNQTYIHLERGFRINPD